MSAWRDTDGTVAFGVSRTGELLELRRIRRGWRIVAHVDPKDGGEMIEVTWECSNGPVAYRMFGDFLGLTERGRNRKAPWIHPAQGDDPA